MRILEVPKVGTKCNPCFLLGQVRLLDSASKKWSRNFRERFDTMTPSSYFYLSASRFRRVRAFNHVGLSKCSGKRKLVPNQEHLTSEWSDALSCCLKLYVCCTFMFKSAIEFGRNYSIPIMIILLHSENIHSGYAPMQQLPFIILSLSHLIFEAFNLGEVDNTAFIA